MSFIPPLDFGAPFSASALISELQPSSEDDHVPMTEDTELSPTSPTRNHVEFEISSSERTESFCSVGRTLSRGRTLVRVPARRRTASRPRRRSSCVRSALSELSRERSRFTSLDLTASPEQFPEEALLEPKLPARFRSSSLSEELYRAAAVNNVADLTQFIGHRDTFALLGIRRLHNRAIYLPREFFQIFANYIDFDTYKALRLSCRHWSQGITRARALHLRGAIRLPAEILQRMYSFLPVADFDAARHTCRSWMVASLEERQLSTMLRQGGWSRTTDLDMNRLEKTSGRRMSGVSRNWLLSKRLATECALSRYHILDVVDGSVPERGDLPENLGPLHLTAKIDFAEVAQTRILDKSADPPLRFDVSACQKYLLVTKASTILIYSLIAPISHAGHEHGGFIRVFNILQCPSRVLAVSMDTSSHRLSVAALLGDRMGIVFDMDGKRSLEESPSPTGSSQTFTSGPGRRASTSGLPAFNANGFFGMHSLPQSEGIFAAPCATSTYQNVCLAQDPPLSVAICPQKRCVAFGNASGIEVHWVDALSGEGLQRWFPLSSRSESLFFLPNNVDIDSANRLRLIASAAQPLQSQISARQYPTRTEALNKKGPWTDFTNEDQAWKLNWAFSRMSVPRSTERPPDYYNARPLSDGKCVLFVDPNSHKLVLGADHTLNLGVTRLARRFVLNGPDSSIWTPFVYAAGSDLRYGPRIFAGYAKDSDPSSINEVWLFSVPPDLFWSENPSKASKAEAGPESCVYNVPGISVAKLAHLSAVAVDAADGDLTLHAFTLEKMGQAYVWQLASADRTLQKSVLADGVTIPVISAESFPGDVRMEDADDSPSAYVDEGVQIDKADSGIHGFSFRPHRSSFDGASEDIEIDADGDVVMRDVIFETERPTPPKPPRTPSPVPPPPLFFADGGAQTHVLEEEDEGYASMQEHDGLEDFHRLGGIWAINVPPIHQEWTQNDDWIPQYLADHGSGIEDKGLGVDVLAATELELEVRAL